MLSAIARRECDCVAERRVSKVRRHNLPNPICYSSGTDIVRASQGQRSIQRSDGKGVLGLAGTRSKRIADHALVSADRRLDLGSLIVAAGFLPRHEAPFGSHPQVTVALCRDGLGRGTHNRARQRRHDDIGIRMTLGDRLTDPVLIVIAVGDEGCDGIDDLVEQRVNHRTIIDFFPGQAAQVWQDQSFKC
jgi:hypothetical protein